MVSSKRRPTQYDCRVGRAIREDDFILLTAAAAAAATSSLKVCPSQTVFRLGAVHSHWFSTNLTQVLISIDSVSFSIH